MRPRIRPSLLLHQLLYRPTKQIVICLFYWLWMCVDIIIYVPLYYLYMATHICLSHWIGRFWDTHRLNMLDTTPITYFILFVKVDTCFYVLCMLLLPRVYNLLLILCTRKAICAFILATICTILCNITRAMECIKYSFIQCAG